jgi:multidrug resistance efflux pump
MKKVLDKSLGLFIKFGLPVLSVLLIAVAVRTVIANSHDLSLKAPLAEPSKSPFPLGISAQGMLEPSTENIYLAARTSGRVSEVCVVPGQQVRKGEAVFRLDDPHLQAQRIVLEAEVESLKAQLVKLKSLPRPEEVPGAEAQVAEAKASLQEAEDDYRRAQRLGGAISAETLVKSRQGRERAKARLLSAEAALHLLKAGTSAEDLAVAEAAKVKAEAMVKQVRSDLAELTVTAPVDGTILQVCVHPGESITPSTRAVTLGEVSRLRVKVNIDEHEVPRLQAGATAYASVVGKPDLVYPLTFVRIEPFMSPKQALTGDNRDSRIDTRVLPVIYQVVPPRGAPLWVGQQVNVYIETVDGPTGAAPISPKT